VGQWLSVEETRGGLTFVFTDIEGSTRLVRDLQSSYGLVLRIHRRILETCFTDQGGKEMGTEGDALFFVFPAPARAVAAAIAAQRWVELYDWPEGMRLRVRMGIHQGPVTVSGGEYVGLTVHEVSRLCSAAHGGQILCSGAVAESLGTTPGDAVLRDLGAYQLRGIPEARSVYQVSAPDLEDDFPPPREAVRDGGVRVTIWQREPLLVRRSARQPGDLDVCAVDGTPLGGGTRIEVRPASSGHAGAFRLIVLDGATVEEEYDGLTSGGATDAAAVVNAHSRLIRIQPGAEQGVPVASRQPGSRL